MSLEKRERETGLVLALLYSQSQNRVVLKLPISPQDAWIAATALHYDLLLVTHNVRDFQEISELQLYIASG